MASANADRQELVLKKHIYVIHKIDLEAQQRQPHRTTAGCVGGALQATKVAAAAVAAAAGGDDDGDGDDEYADDDGFEDDSADDFDDDNEGKTSLSTVAAADSGSAGDGSGGGGSATVNSDDVDAASDIEAVRERQQQRHFCSWLGCTEPVFDSSHPADTLLLRAMAGSSAAAAVTTAAASPTLASLLHPLVFTLCATHARTFQTLQAAKGGKKELRKSVPRCFVFCHVARLMLFNRTCVHAYVWHACAQTRAPLLNVERRSA